MTYDFDTLLNRRGTNCMKWDSLASEFGRADLLPFWVADMDFRSAPEIIEVLAGQVDFGVFGYPIMTERARTAVADWQRTRHGWDVRPDEVAFVPGVVTALSVAVNAFTEPGDGIVLQTPVYPPFFSVVRDNGRVIVENPLREAEGRYEMDFDNLREVLRPGVKALILCSPHNPVARVWSREELVTLAGICAERNVMVLCDEIHQDLVFRDARHLPLSLAAPELDPLLLTLVAPSKTFNIAGICASAWIARDNGVAQTMQRELERLHLTELNMMAIAALEAAYTKGAPWLDRLLSYLEENRSFVLRFLKERLPRVKLKHPEGTFIFWLDFRDYGLHNDELQRILVKEAGVALNPGINFGESGDGFARLNVGCPRAQLEEGMRRIERAFAGRSAKVDG